MKAKLGKLALLEKLAYNNYKALLKKAVNGILGDVKSGGICKFVLLSGEAIAWNGEAAEAEQPLLYLESNTASLVKDIKQSIKDIKAYAYGTCKVVDVGGTVQVFLCPEKGKLTQAATLKPLKKVFKKFKPKIYISMVASLEEANAGIIEDEDDNATNEVLADTEMSEEQEAAELTQKIGKNLQKYHLGFKKIKDLLETADAEEKQALLIKRNAIAKQLKHLCVAWEEEVVPNAETLIQSAEEKTWQTIYEYWDKALDKLEEAKEGKSDDPEARKAEEERLYAKTLKDIEQFYENMEKGEGLHPSVIESNLENLQQHYEAWEKFAADDSSLAAELAEVKTQLAEMQADWNELKPLAIAYQEASEELEKALAGDNADLVEERYSALERAYNEIVKL